ncbi:esterase-like activity of phytase family protein [Flavobacterium sp.]|uniref:esterase-like activity of phytase family protein n=1 Tax=Flavobacterium sp. TaxID=239 RepID=UPI0038FC9033
MILKRLNVKLFTITIMCFASKMNGQITLDNTYQNTSSQTIGIFQGITFREGGFSSLQYIPNTNGTEFWTVTDRGVNIDAATANTGATASAQYPTCIPTYDKIYAFPNYAPKIMRLKIVGNEVQIMQMITIKRPNGNDATGLLNPTGFGSTSAEVASTNVVTDCANFDANTAPKDAWGIDSEGIDVDSEGNFWISEEGGPTIWKVSPNGIVLKRYTPYTLTEPEDVAINSCFAFRRNNRGFEGITIAPNGKVYAIIQSPMYYKNVSGVVGSATLGNSRIHRILEIDPTTNTQKMYAYVNDGQIGTSSDIRPRDLKIGDIKAINNTTFLVIEQGLRGAQNIKRLYKIDITGATEVLSGIAYGTKTLEELDSPANLTSNGITPVTKTLQFDLHANGWPTTIEKAEGIAIIDANTIVLCNDNDYGQYSPTENGIATPNNMNSSLYKYTLAGSNALQNYIPNNNVVLSNTDFIAENKTFKVRPNPFINEITIDNLLNEQSSYTIINTMGQEVMSGKISFNKINLEVLKTGIYLLKIDSQFVKIVKN